MYSAKGHLASPRWGCPIRTSPDHSLLATPRGFSQPSTSFIGSWCQGIHRAPLPARRLDLSQHTKPAGSTFSNKKDLSFVCSTTLQFFRYASFEIEGMAQKKPDVRRANSGP